MDIQGHGLLWDGGKAYQDQAFNADTTGFILASAREGIFEMEAFRIALRETACSELIEVYRVARKGRRRAVRMMEEQVIEDTEVGGRSSSRP